MALAALSGDEQLVIFVQLCNVLDPGVAVAFGSASSELWELTQAPRQQLQADYEAAAALGRKAGKRSCKELREAKMVAWYRKGLSSDDLALLGTLGSVLPALETLVLIEPAAGPDGVPRLAEKLGAGALPAVTLLYLNGMRVGTNGAPLRSSTDRRLHLPRGLGLGALDRVPRASWAPGPPWALERVAESSLPKVPCVQLLMFNLINNVWHRQSHRRDTAFSARQRTHPERSHMAHAREED